MVFGFNEESDPDRKGVVDTFKEDGILAGLGSVAGMMIPQSAQMAGQDTAGDIFSDFVEFGPIGDVKDVMSGLTDPNLDFVERGMSLLPIVGGVATTAAVTATAVHATRQGQARLRARQQNITRMQQTRAELEQVNLESTIRPGGVARWDPATPDTVDPGELDLEGRAELAADLAQYAAETNAREGAFAPMHTADFSELAAVVDHQYNEVSGAEGPRGYTSAELEPALRVIGNQLVQAMPENTYSNTQDPAMNDMPATIDEQQLVAAQWATTRMLQGVEQGILVRSDGEAISLQGFIGDLAGRKGPDRQVNALHMVVGLEQKMMNMSQGPDWTPTPGQSVVAAYFDVETGDSRVFLSMNEGLLPTQRLIDYQSLTPVDKAEFLRRQTAMNDPAIIADMAANLILSYQREAMQHPERLQDSRTWYRRQHNQVKYMSEVTGHSMETVAAYYAVLSQVTKWVPDNVVASTHLLLQNTRPDLAPGSPEYAAVFKEAMEIGGWADAMLKYSGKKLIKKHGLNVDNVIDFWADPANAQTQTGKLRGAETNVKQESIEMLNAGVPWQLFLRTSKYHNFGHGMIDPDMLDLATIDTHSNNATMGMIWTALYGSQGSKDVWKTVQENGETWSDSGDYYGTDMEITPEMLDEARTIMREKLDYSEARIEKLIHRFTKVPAAKNESRYRAQQKAHLVARDYLGLDAGHEVQAITWVEVQERKQIVNAIRKKIKQNAGAGNDTAYGAIWDETMLHHMEGNSAYQQGLAGMTRNASPEVKPPPPANVQKMIAKQTGGIHLEPNADGTTTVWGRVGATNRTLLRHLAPTGASFGEFRQFVPRKARTVRHAAKHVSLAKDQVAPDGLPVTLHTRTAVGNTHVAEQPGNHMVFELPDQDSANELIAQLEELEYPLQVEISQTQFEGGVARRRLNRRQLRGMRFNQRATSPLVHNDWAGISAFTQGHDQDTNLQRHRELGDQLQEMGYNPIESSSAYEGTTERSWVVFGMPYEDAHNLGNEWGQDSVMTREGLVYHDGTFEATNNELLFGEQAEQSGYYSTIKVGNKQVRYALGLDGNRSEKPVNIAELHGRSAEKGPRVQVKVFLGGVDAGISPKITDQVWQKGTGSGTVLSSSAYINGGLWKPPGTMRATEIVVTDGATVSSMRTTADTDYSAGNQFDVYVPYQEWRQLGDQRIHAGESRRNQDRAWGLRVEDLENNQVHIDGDVTLQYPDGSQISRPNNNVKRILGWLVDGEAPKTALIDVAADRPVIMVGEAGYGKGQVEVRLSGGRVTSIQAWDMGDLYKADNALALAGVSTAPEEKARADPPGVPTVEMPGP